MGKNCLLIRLQKVQKQCGIQRFWIQNADEHPFSWHHLLNLPVPFHAQLPLRGWDDALVNNQTKKALIGTILEKCVVTKVDYGEKNLPLL